MTKETGAPGCTVASSPCHPEPVDAGWCFVVLGDSTGLEVIEYFLSRHSLVVKTDLGPRCTCVSDETIHSSVWGFRVLGLKPLFICVLLGLAFPKSLGADDVTGAEMNFPEARNYPLFEKVFLLR